MKASAGIFLIALIAAAAYAGHRFWTEVRDNPLAITSNRATATRTPAQSQAPIALDTTHYTIASTATPAQTASVAAAAESLHDAYLAFFRDSVTTERSQARLSLVLYKDQREFKANNRSSAWAEAFYLAPRCHAYYADGRPNPYHWMLHEATHQLNNERAHFRRVTWIDEGLATYFGSSRLQDHKLLPGTIDANTYPIWWLSSLTLTGNLQEDIRKGRIIPLRDLLASGRDDIGRNVNLHYIEYWSLTHFLFHHDRGRYAGKYKALIAAGGSLEHFERLLGPIDDLQGEWYGYLQQRVAESRSPAGTGEWAAIH